MESEKIVYWYKEFGHEVFDFPSGGKSITKSHAEFELLMCNLIRAGYRCIARDFRSSPKQLTFDFDYE